MANWPLTPNDKDYIINYARALLSRSVCARNLQFPLDYDTIQKHLGSPENLSMLMELRRRGVPDLPSVRSVHLVCDLPGVERRAVVEVAAPTGVPEFLCDRTIPRYYKPYSSSTTIPNHITRFDPDVLSLDEQIALMAWVRDTIFAKRIVGMAATTITEILNNYATTFYHLAVRWPALVQFVLRRAGGRKGSGSDVRDMSGPKPGSRAAANAAWPSAASRDGIPLTTLQKQIRATEAAIAAAMLLPTEEEQHKQYSANILASVVDWVPLPGELYYVHV